MLVDSEAKKLNAEDIKLILGHYFRFKKGFLGCVTEADIYDKEDFIAFKCDEIVCCEVKISKSDFVADFKKYKWKESMPYNRFYFAVPAELKEFALNKINGLIQNNKLHDDMRNNIIIERRYNNIENVGLLVIRDINSVEVAKQAKLINEKKQFIKLDDIGERLLKRLYSEIWNLKYTIEKQGVAQ